MIYPTSHFLSPFPHTLHKGFSTLSALTYIEKQIQLDWGRCDTTVGSNLISSASVNLPFTHSVKQHPILHQMSNPPFEREKCVCVCMCVLVLRIVHMLLWDYFCCCYLTPQFVCLIHCYILSFRPQALWDRDCCLLYMFVQNLAQPAPDLAGLYAIYYKVSIK